MIKTKKRRMIAIISLFIFLGTLGSMRVEVYADSCPDPVTGDCEITGYINTESVYKLGGNTILKTDGSANILAVGINAGANFVGDFGNTYIGNDAGANMIGSRHGTFIGYSVLSNLTYTGNGNTVIGARANQLGLDYGEISATGDFNTVVGFLAGEHNGGLYNTYIGTEAGRYSNIGMHNIAIGVNALGEQSKPNETGANNIHIGGYTESASPDLTSTIAIGHGARVTSDYQMVVGDDSPRYWKCTDNSGDITCESVTQCTESTNVTCKQFGLIKDSYWGSGVVSDNPQDFSFNATGGEGTNVEGANLIISGGQSTGNANGGTIRLQVSPAGTSGASQNNLVDRMIIGIGPNPYYDFQIISSSGNDLLSIPTNSEDLVMAGIGGSKMGVGVMYGMTAKLHVLNLWDGSASFRVDDQSNDTTPFVIDNNGKVGIGTPSPLSNLAIAGLPNTPPAGDSSGAKGILCITNAGNVWVDTNISDGICGL